MIDVHQKIREYLLLSADLREMVDERIYAGRDVPPVGYLPGEGGCVVFRVRGGGPDYDDALLNSSIQFKCYGENEIAAFEVYLALYDHLHNGKSSQVLHAESETLGQPLEEPDTEWHFVLAYFSVILRQE